jgi:hypothetical protein
MPIDMRPPWIEAAISSDRPSELSERDRESRRRKLQNLLDAITGNPEASWSTRGMSERQSISNPSCACTAEEPS